MAEVTKEEFESLKHGLAMGDFSIESPYVKSGRLRFDFVIAANGTMVRLCAEAGLADLPLRETEAAFSLPAVTDSFERLIKKSALHALERHFLLGDEDEPTELAKHYPADLERLRNMDGD